MYLRFERLVPIDPRADPEAFAKAMKRRKKWSKRVRRTWKQMRKRGVFDGDEWLSYIQGAKGEDRCHAIIVAMALDGLKCADRERDELAHPMQKWANNATLTGALSP